MNRQEVAVLHAHTNYSELDGIATSSEYAIRTMELNDSSKKYKITAMSINQHGHLHGMFTDHDNIVAKGIKHIPGIEVYHNCDDIVIERFKDGRSKDRFHLVLYAMTQEGLSNMYKIATESGKNKFKSYKDFAITTESMLRKYGKGIIASTACMGSVFAKLIKDGKSGLAKQKLIEYSKYFDELYLEVQPHEHPDQIIYNNTLVQWSQELNLPIVIGIDCHYVGKSQSEYYDVLNHIRLFKADKKGEVAKDIESSDFILDYKSFEDMEDFCIKYGIPLEAIYNTKVIADKCIVDVYPKSSKHFLPKFPVPKGYTEKTWLRKKVNDGLIERTKKHGYTDIAERIKRINYELDVIHHTGYDGYFLYLNDLVTDARKMNIPLGPGRGSGASALVNFNLNITNVDPIENDFLFSRFITKERKDDPD